MYALAHGYCIGCGKLFSFNPLRVPSSSAITGEREPICKVCVERINPLRKKNGLPEIVPAKDAYDAVDEGELR